jgi:hypothetical protein
MDSSTSATADPFTRLKEAFEAGDAARVREVITANPQLKAQINEPWGPFDSPPIVNVRSQ